MRQPAELIGRDRELVAIDRMLGGAEEGRLSALLIQAKPGLGASALLSTAVAKARAKGFRVLLAAAHEFEVHWPFATIAELLDLRAADSDPQRSRLQSDLVREVQNGDTEPTEPFFAKRVVDALLGFEGPTLLALDDLHFADDQSIATLNRAVRRGQERPLAVVITCREGEPRQRVRGLWESLRGYGAGVMRLAPLPDDDLEKLASSQLGAPPSRRLTEQLAGAGGFPLWVVEYIEHALEEKAIAVEEQADLVSDELPGDFRDFVISRTSALEPLALATLEWLSIAVEASTSLLAALMHEEPADVARALDECRLEGLLHEEEGSWVFDQELVRNAVYSATSDAIRLGRHIAVAEGLEATGTSADRVAEQWLLATTVPSQELVDKIRSVARRLVPSAPYQGLRLLRRADELTEHFGLSRVEILGERTAAALDAGAAGDAARAAQTLLDLPEAREQHPRARVLLGRALLLERRYGEAAQLLSLEQHLDQPLVLAYEALASAWSFDLRKAEECLSRFDELGAPPDESVTVANAARASVLHLRGRVLQAAETASAALFDVSSVRGEHSRLRWLFCELLAFADRQEESERLLELEQTRAPIATPHVAAGLMYVTALNRYLLGRWDALDQILDSALTIDPDRESFWIETDVKALRALVALHRDDIDAAEGLAHALVAADARLDPYLGLGVIALELQLPSNRKRVAELVSVAGEKLEDAHAAGIQHLHWQVCLPLVRAASANGNGEVCRLCVEVAEDVALSNPFPSAQAVGAMCRAVLERDAERGRRAVELVAESPRRVLQAGVYESAAALLADAGDRKAAIDHYVAGLRIFEDLGATRDANRVLSGLRALGVTRQKLALTDSKAEGWGALTPAEWRVVKLAARGHTTPAIAQRLYLSPRTVQSHLRSSFRKLNVTTRAELAALVSEWLLTNGSATERE